MPAPRPPFAIPQTPASKVELVSKVVSVIFGARRVRKHYLRGNSKRMAFYAFGAGEQMGLLIKALPKKTFTHTVPFKGGRAKLTLTFPTLPSSDAEKDVPAPVSNADLANKAASVAFGVLWARRHSRRGNRKRTILWYFWAGEQWGQLGKDATTRFIQSEWFNRKVDEYVEKKMAQVKDRASTSRRERPFPGPIVWPDPSPFKQTPTSYGIVAGQRFSVDFAGEPGYATVLCVSEADEKTEYGTQPWPAVWYRFDDGHGEVISSHPEDFLRISSPAV